MPSRPIHQVLSDRPFVSVPADTPVREVVRQMSALQRSAALVTEHGVLTGIFTERDAAFGVLAAGLDADTTPGGRGDDAQPGDADRGPPFGHALHLMYENGVRHVPIVDANRRPLGVVTARDALQLDALTFGAELVRREEITVIL